MTSYGSHHCDPNAIAWSIGSQGLQTEDNVWYYDGTKVYQQIAAYTQNPDWYRCASYTNSAYRNWVEAVSGSSLGGWRVFPDGLANDYWRTGDPLSRHAAVHLAWNSALAWSGGSSECGYSRETAYLLNAYVVAEELGEPRHPMFATAADNALRQLQQSFVTNECTFVMPFMMGLTMEALIRYYEHTGDPRVLPAVEAAADGMWARYWSANGEAFFYSSNLEGPALFPELSIQLQLCEVAKSPARNVQPLTCEVQRFPLAFDEQVRKRAAPTRSWPS